MSEIISKRDVARILKVSSATVQRLYESGKIKSFRIGRLVKFREIDVADFVEKQLNEGKSA